MLVVCTGAYLLRVHRRRCAAFVLGSAGCRSWFGHPLAFGQSVVAAGAIEDGFRRPVASSWSESLPGLLFSRARGLVWFSPVLVLGFLSAAAVWRNPRYRALIPL